MGYKTWFALVISFSIVHKESQLEKQPHTPYQRWSFSALWWLGVIWRAKKNLNRTAWAHRTRLFVLKIEREKKKKLNISDKFKHKVCLYTLNIDIKCCIHIPSSPPLVI